MNREIKFRAWDKDYKEMLQVKAIIFNPKTLIPDRERMEPYILDEHNDIHYLNDIELLEYTGIKDNKGKEIYEGDIIQTKDFYECGELVFKGEMEVVKDLNYYINGCVFIDTSGEVVGNVYENPELLEVK